ncbi:MAG: VWA domain-containing protein [Chloroflexota bacterium]
MDPNYYARLGVPRDATLEEIKEAFRDIARQLHPDVSPDPNATELFIKVQEAYKVLSTPQKRAAYDVNLPPEATSAPKILVNTLYSREFIPPLDEPQLVYVLLDLLPTVAFEEREGSPLNICLVLDRSTSMHGKRMDTVKAAATEILRQLRPQDVLSIVTFSDNADILLPATRGVDINKGEIRISMLQTSGGTEILQGLQAAYQQINRYRNPEYINYIILLTDGHTYGDENASLELAEQAAQGGVGISALGIGNDWNDEFLDSLASKTGGHSLYISDPKELKRFLETEISGLEQVYAEQVTLDLDTSENVELRYAFRLSPEVGVLPTTNPLFLGSIPGQTHLTILLEYLISSTLPQETRLTIAEATLALDIPSLSIPTSHLKFRLSLPIQEGEAEKPPPQTILLAMSRLTLYRMQEQARADMTTGHLEQAKTRLKNLASHLSSQGHHDLAKTVLIEANRLEQGKPMTKEGEKKIKYGTRSLLLPATLETKG